MTKTIADAIDGNSFLSQQAEVAGAVTRLLQAMREVFAIRQAWQEGIAPLAAQVQPLGEFLRVVRVGTQVAGTDVQHMLGSCLSVGHATREGFFHPHQADFRSSIAVRSQ